MMPKIEPNQTYGLAMHAADVANPRKLRTMMSLIQQTLRGLPESPSGTVEFRVEWIPRAWLGSGRD